MALDMYAALKNVYSAVLHKLRVATSNANNINTPGFKSADVSFSTLYSKYISSGTDKQNPMILETSLTVGSTRTQFSQGNLGLGSGLDAAIVGEGFFITASSSVQSTADGDLSYTRSGRFQFDFNNEFLVDDHGRKVFGFRVNQNGDRVSNELVPIESSDNLDVGFIEGGILVTNFEAHKESVAEGNEEHPEQVKLFRLALQTFSNKQGLVQDVGTSYRPSLAAGEAITPGMSGEAIYGNVFPESLENSNVDIAQVGLDMTLINRHISAVNGIIDDLNKIISNAISKLAG